MQGLHGCQVSSVKSSQAQPLHLLFAMSQWSTSEYCEKAISEDTSSLCDIATAKEVKDGLVSYIQEACMTGHDII